MPKKLKLTLREPVKLHETKSQVPEIPLPFGKENERMDRQPERLDKTNSAIAEKVETKQPSESVKTTLAPVKKSREVEFAENDLIQTFKNMSPRIRQIWEYFCKIAKADGILQNSFAVTRAEVMKEAGIGSSNTYRDALRKFQDEGLLEIELRPGKNAGSVFHLTKKGLNLAQIKTS